MCRANALDRAPTEKGVGAGKDLPRIRVHPSYQPTVGGAAGPDLTSPVVRRRAHELHWRSKGEAAVPIGSSTKVGAYPSQFAAIDPAVTTAAPAAKRARKSRLLS